MTEGSKRIIIESCVSISRERLIKVESDKSTALFIHGRITRFNSDVTTTMNLVVVSSRVLHVLTYANNPCRFAKL